MTNEYEMNEFDFEWQPGPVVEIDWWGGKFEDDSEYVEEDDTSDIILE